MVICKRKKGAPSVVVTVALLGACFPSLEASARSSAPEGCAKAPTSPLVVDVKDKGAKGDGRTDDTAAIQSAIDKVAGTGGTVFVPDGRYMVDAVAGKHLTLKSDMTFKLSTGATLKAIPNSADNSAILTIERVSNVTVVGGTLEGEREEHLSKSGEWGMGIRIDRGAKHITVSGVTAKKMWGDGFFVHGVKDVSFCSVIADRNRRQGLSVIEVDGLLVTNSVFSNTHGTRPSAGIDLEPDDAQQQINNVRIENSKFLNNVGAGIMISGKKGTTNISNVEINRNLFTGIPPIKIEYAPAVLNSAICRNRQITPRSDSSGNLSPFAGPAVEVVFQSECGDPRIQIRR